MSNRYFQASVAPLEHPHIQTWRSYLSIPGVEALSVAVERRRDPFGYGPASIVVQFLDGHCHELKRDRVAWDEALDNWLVEQKARAIDDDHEVHRTELRLHDRFEALLRQYGDGRFNSALMFAVRNGPLAKAPSVRALLDRIHEAPPESGRTFTSRVEEVDRVFTRIAHELKRALTYALKTAEKILAASVALYLNERFHVSELPPPPRLPRR